MEKSRLNLNSPKVAPYVFVLPFVLILAVFFIYPIISTIVMSFQSVNISVWCQSRQIRLCFRCRALIDGGGPGYQPGSIETYRRDRKGGKVIWRQEVLSFQDLFSAELQDYC